jgi:Flp pilus assembly protein TadG
MGTSETAGNSSRIRRRRGLLALARRLGTHQRGVTMVEFALIMLPFLLLVFGIFEVGLVTWGGLELDNATSDVARMVRTGQAQGENYSEEQMKEEVCEHVSLLFDCKTKLRIDVRTFPNFASMTAPTPLDGKGLLKADFPCEMGGSESIVLMTTFYEWPLLNIVSSMSLSNMPNHDNYLLTASAAFRNEPFADK